MVIFEKKFFHFIKKWVYICQDDHPTIQEHWSLQAGAIFIDKDMIKHALKKLPESLAAGLDRIPALLLKKCAGSLLGPIHALWQKSY